MHAHEFNPLGCLATRCCWNLKIRLQMQCESYRNFPDEAERGEELLREAYGTQMERLGVLVEDGGLVVDLGCGSGTSTR